MKQNKNEINIKIKETQINKHLKPNKNEDKHEVNIKNKLH